MKSLLLAAALSTSATVALAADTYTLDSSHSQILFSYNHLGFSTTWGMFSGFEGEIMFDQEDSAASSVSVSMATKSMFTGWEQRSDQFMSEEFLGATDEDMITFASTGIEVTGEYTANITGDLTLNDVTKSVVLEAVLNQAAKHPMAGKDWVGFDATTTLIRSEFGLGKFAPFIGTVAQIQQGFIF